MIRSSLFALALAAAAASCASTSDTQAASGSTSMSSQAAATTPAPAAQAQPATPTAPAETAAPGEYTDAQLRGFVAASNIINPIMQASGGQLTPEQITQVRDALTSNGLDSDSYNAIASAMRTDMELAARVQALQTAEPAAPSAQ